MKPVKQQVHYAEPVRPGPMPKCSSLEALVHPQTGRNFVYMLLSFPLGLAYFISIVVGLSLGLGTMIIWIGIFILLATFLLVRFFTGLERHLVRTMLNTTIPSRQVPYRQFSSEQTVFEKAKSLAFSGETWAGVGYLLLKFPLGVISFVVTVALVPVHLQWLSRQLDSVWRGLMQFGNWHVDTPLESIPFSIAGMFLLFFSVHILNGLAWLHAQWAKLCLKRAPKW